MDRASLSAPFTPVARDRCRNGPAIGTSPLEQGRWVRWGGEGGVETERGKLGATEGQREPMAMNFVQKYSLGVFWGSFAEFYWYSFKSVFP